jgi:hypothetical protein
MEKPKGETADFQGLPILGNPMGIPEIQWESRESDGNPGNTMGIQWESDGNPRNTVEILGKLSGYL